MINHLQGRRAVPRIPDPAQPKSPATHTAGDVRHCFSMKRGRVPWSRELGIRAVIVVVVILLLRLGAFRGHGLNMDPWRAGLGLALFFAGLGFPIWARVHLGRNWGTPDDAEGRARTGDQRALPPGPPPDLVGHPGRRRRHRGGAELAVADRRGPGRCLLRLQRDRRALLDRAVPRHLPGVQALDQMLVPFIF